MNVPFSSRRRDAGNVIRCVPTLKNAIEIPILKLKREEKDNVSDRSWKQVKKETKNG